MKTDPIEDLYISRTVIQNVLPITNRIDLNLDPDVNVFIGPNATGKTTILRVLKSKGPHQLFSFLTQGVGKIGQVYVNGEDTNEIASLPLVWIPATRIPLQTKEYAPIGMYYDEEFEPPNDSSDPPAVIFGSEVASMINHHYSDIHNTEMISRIWEVGVKAMACAAAICPEVIRGDKPGDYIERSWVNSRTARGELIPVTEVHHLMGMSSLDDNDGWTFVADMSAGTQNVYLWILYAALRLAYFHGWFDERANDNWQNEPGVLLIDEIENHLHPAWQRRILFALREHFPKLQVFATTHSPFVIAGLNSGQVHRLSREGNGIVYATPNKERIRGWTVEEILREFMEIHDPTDDRTAEAAATLRWIRAQSPAPGEAEEWLHAKIVQLADSAETTPDENAALRWLLAQAEPEPGNDAATWLQDASDKLRTMVSRDLEAGGPIAAQNQLFLEQLAHLLDDDDGTEADEGNE